jgi:hypothetical protein
MTPYDPYHPPMTPYDHLLTVCLISIPGGRCLWICLDYSRVSDNGGDDELKAGYNHG